MKVFDVSLRDFEISEKEWRSSPLSYAGNCLLLSQNLRDRVSNNNGKPLLYPITLPNSFFSVQEVISVFQKLIKNGIVDVKSKGDNYLVTVREDDF